VQSVDKNVAEVSKVWVRRTNRGAMELKTVFAQNQAGNGISGVDLIKKCCRYYLLSEADTAKLITQYVRDGYLSLYDPAGEETRSLGLDV